VYFVVFDSPGFDTFRQHLVTLTAPPAAGAPTFEPGALSPVVIIAAAPPTFDTWFPLRVDRAQDCVAPIQVQ